MKPLNYEAEKKYRDFSQVTEEEFLSTIVKEEEDPAVASSEKRRSCSKRKGSGGAEASVRSNTNFPVKLHYMLEEVERDGYDDIIAWQPHGRCFLVHKPKEFVEKLLPFWFSQSKIASFQRQLNIYGFQRITTGRDRNGYYHELFLRSKRFLSQGIIRQKFKGTGPRKPSEPEKEPNLYSYPHLPATKSASERPAGIANMQKEQYKPQQGQHQELTSTNMQLGSVNVFGNISDQNSSDAGVGVLERLLHARQHMLALQQRENSMLLQAIHSSTTPVRNIPVSRSLSIEPALATRRNSLLHSSLAASLGASQTHRVKNNSNNAAAASLEHFLQLDSETSRHRAWSPVYSPYNGFQSQTSEDTQADS